ncbi:MAG: N-acetylmuramoyl-L-alanine amidase, partial [Lachnospiraceae bacterium]|nr:N-acetylmuramoyl-L-alanine amidase [Lachnospiraceae bacterium]
MNSNNPDVIISIHQNSFTQESSKGAQVFYQTSSDDGKKLAEIMQMQLVEDLDKNNHRVAKPNSDYYILKNSTGTAIIVECGFLSNKEESALLCSNDYQEKVADSISKGIIKYLEGGKDGNKDTED